MDLYGKFTEKGYAIAAYLPSKKGEPHEWYVTAHKGRRLVKELHIPLLHPVLFGVDVSDKATLEERVDEMLKKLP
jgi:hypothetical protein